MSFCGLCFYVLFFVLFALLFFISNKKTASLARGRLAADKESECRLRELRTHNLILARFKILVNPRALTM